MRWVVGLLLIGASTLKAVQLITEPSVLLAVGRFVLPVQIGAEFAVGVLSLAGLYWRILRWLSLLLFSGFAGYSFYLATSGAATCGCFGAIDVHPWWTFALDLAIALGLLIRGREQESASSPKFAVAAAAFSISGATALGFYAAPQASEASGITVVGDLSVLEPEKWIRKPLPIADFIDLDLSRGKWIVLLHRHDCPECQAAVPKYEQLATITNVALVEVPPFATARSKYPRLRDDRDWFIQTPVEIQLDDGVVISASNELPSLD